MGLCNYLEASPGNIAATIQLFALMDWRPALVWHWEPLMRCTLSCRINVEHKLQWFSMIHGDSLWFTIKVWSSKASGHGKGAKDCLLQVGSRLFPQPIWSSVSTPLRDLIELGVANAWNRSNHCQSNKIHHTPSGGRKSFPNLSRDEMQANGHVQQGPYEVKRKSKRKENFAICNFWLLGTLYLLACLII
jgi:hypothetical protein